MNQFNSKIIQLGYIMASVETTVDKINMHNILIHKIISAVKERLNFHMSSFSCAYNICRSKDTGFRLTL